MFPAAPLFTRILLRLRANPLGALSRFSRLVRLGGLSAPFQLARVYSEVNTQYQNWRKSTVLTDAALRDMEQHVEGFGYRPSFSVIVPTYNVAAPWLTKMINSVRQQIYPDWELCIADDSSSMPHIREILDDYCAADPRIKVTYRSQRGHISEATNAALSMATGEFVALLDHDDEISPDALFWYAQLLNEHPDADFIYCDEDRLELTGDHTEPFFKPGWSPHLLMCVNYITHFAVIRRQIIEEIGGLRSEFVGSQDYDLFLRITEKSSRVFHIPRVLYSWRKVPSSTALSGTAKDYAHQASRRALIEAVERRAIPAAVEEGSYLPILRIRRQLPAIAGVSIILRIRDWNARAVERQIKQIIQSVQLPFEMSLVVSQTDSIAAASLIKGFKHDLKLHVDSYLPRALNDAAHDTTSPYLLFLEDGLLPKSKGWVQALLEHAQQESIGAVGAKITDTRNRIVHAGIGLGSHGPRFIGAGLLDIPHGVFALNLKDIEREVSAISGCMMLQRSVFEAVSGFDEHYRGSLYDVDLCLRLQEGAKSTIYTPYAHFQTSSLPMRAPVANRFDLDHLANKWKPVFGHDPFCSAENLHMDDWHTNSSDFPDNLKEY